MAGGPQFDADSFGDLLRSHRLAANLTQEALAERAGLSTRGISDLERGARTQPYRETLRALVTTLGLAGAERAAFLGAARGSSRPAADPGPRRIASALPVPLNRLIGREPEMAAVTALLSEEPVRLVTLSGPGGVGKTRLALAVAARMAGDFRDGVVFVDLAPLRDPALLPELVAAACGRNERGTASPMEYLQRALSGRRVLLLLDNYEHLLDAAPVVSDLLHTGSGVKALVTSREALRLQGEREYPVPPLDVPDLAAASWRGDALRSESVQLFVLRAAESQTGFALTDENAASVVGICRELDGLPLAIELAAPRIKILPVPALLARLEQRLPLLTSGARDAPARQRSLRDAIGWSYDLLPEPEQILFRRLAVFMGGFTIEAVEAVTEGAPLRSGGEGSKGEWKNGHPASDLRLPAPFPPSPLPPAPLDVIASLVDKSLLRRDDRGDGLRFAMLETIREFAGERLRATDDEEEVARAAHAKYFLVLVEEAHRGLTGPEQATWLARLDDEDANIRAALSWSMAREAAAAALGGARALWRFWAARGRLDEGRTWLERALALPGAGRVSREVRADAHNALGNLLGETGEFALARTHHQQALALRRELGDAEAIAGALNNLGLIAAWLGDYPAATSLHTESLALRRERQDPFAIALSLTNLGDVLTARGEFAGARALHLDALGLRDLAQDAAGSAYSRYNLGEIARLEGDIAEAARYLAESLRRFELLGDKIGAAYAEWSLGDLASREGHGARAAELLGRVLHTRLEIGDQRGTIECLEAIAIAALRHGAPWMGLQLLTAAAARREAIACPLPPSAARDHQRDLAAYRQSGLPDATMTARDVTGPENALELAWEIVHHLREVGSGTDSPGEPEPPAGDPL